MKKKKTAALRWMGARCWHGREHCTTTPAAFRGAAHPPRVMLRASSECRPRQRRPVRPPCVLAAPRDGACSLSLAPSSSVLSSARPG
eukprot:3124508-Prorocentrum_lima.AAC.1